MQITCRFPGALSIDATASYTTSFLESWPQSMTTYSFQQILDLLAADMLVGMSLESSRSGIRSLSVYAHTSCQQSASMEECFSAPAYLVLSAARFLYANGSILANDGRNLEIPETLHSSILNYLQALSAASLADTGNWRNNSIFVSPDPGILNATLQPNTEVSAAVVHHPSYNAYYSPSFNSSAAQMFRTNEGWLFGTPVTGPVTISMTYTCRLQQRRHLLNFVICTFSFFLFFFISYGSILPTAVLVADLSLFATFWSIFSYAASTMARSKVPRSDGK